MKTIYITIVLLFMSLGLMGQKQATEQKVFDDITNAVKAGQVTELSAYFATSIECDMLGNDNVYSKAQATQIMKDFFAKYKPKSFSPLHKSGKGQVKYIIGSYATTAGETFRMTFFVKQEGDTFLLQQIRVETDNAA